MSRSLPTKQLEHIATMDQVLEFLREKGQNPDEICPLTYDCKLWKLEDILYRYLATAKRFSAKRPNEADRIRGLIRAGSWYTYQHEQKKDLLTDAKALLAEKEDERAKMILSAIQRGTPGSRALRMVEAIEDLLSSRSRAKTKIDLRPLRDQLYFQYLYPNWFKQSKQ